MTYGELLKNCDAVEVERLSTATTVSISTPDDEARELVKLLKEQTQSAAVHARCRAFLGEAQ